MLNEGRKGPDSHWSQKGGETVDLSDHDVPEMNDLPNREVTEEDLPELSSEHIEPLDEPTQEAPAQIATAYGGHAAEQAVGISREQKSHQSEYKASQKTEQEKEQALREAGVNDVRKKLENGMSPEDLLDMIEGEMEEIEFDIDDQEEGENQATVLKSLYGKRSVLDAQKQEIQKHLARKEAA